MTNTGDQSDLHSLIVKYQSEGLSLFPLPFMAKKDDTFKWGVYQERRPTQAEISGWFNGSPSNIAVVCGPVSGNLVVLEFDVEDNFAEFNAGFCERHSESIFDFTRVTKGKRGPHVWLRVKQAVKSQKFPKCEIRAEGNYIVVPPSVHPDGPKYQFLSDLPIREIESLEEVGIDVSQQRTGTTLSGNAPGWISQLLQGVGAGERNNAAIKLAGYFRNSQPIDITQRLLTDWNTRNTPPMPLEELLRTIESAYRLPPHPHTPNGDTKDILRICPEISPPVSQRDKSVTESVTKGLSERIETWVAETTGWFSYEECDKEVGIRDTPDKDNRRQIFKRLKEAGKLEAHPRDNKLLRYVNTAVRRIDFKSAIKRAPLSVKYPFGIERYFNTYPGNIIVVAGAADAGKTGFLLNFIRLNQFDFSIFYQNSEMGREELASRLENFEGITLDEWNFTAEERSHDFADVIRPDCINIVDYMELSGDFYQVADYLRQIHDRLASGIAIVALQKKRGASLGRGGDFGLEKPRLYLAMDDGKITIEKAKNWTNPKNNPNRLVANFKVVGGCKFIVTSDWHKDQE